MSLQRNMLLKASVADAKTQKLFRVLWEQKATDIAFLLDVSGPIPGSRMPERKSWSELDTLKATGKLTEVEECLATSEMTLADTELSQAQIDSRDKKYALIEQLVSTESTLLTVLNATTRGAAVRAASMGLGVESTRLYRLLTIYWWYGQGRSSLLSRQSLMGGRGKLREPGLRKRGRPNSVSVLEGTNQFAGVNVTAKDLKKFLKALNDYWIKKNCSLPETHRRMQREIYVKWNKDAEGKTVKHHIDSRLVPSLEQFYYHTRRLIAEHNLLPRKHGDLAWAQLYKSRPGSSSDIANGPTDVYDMDVVQLKCIIVTDTRAPEVVGLMSACLCVDRVSGAIVGFHDFIGSESWDCYRLALFWGLTSTEKHLKAIKLDNEAKTTAAWGAYGWCNGVYVDRGPARGKDAYMAIVDSLKLERAVAPARRGDLKAVIESVNGRFQIQIGSLTGGYSRKKGLRNEEQAKAAKNNAGVTHAKARKFLVAAIAEHNQFHDASSRLTKDMIFDGIKPTPIEIYRWGQREYRGQTVTPLSESELYLRLLPKTERSVWEAGIRHRNSTYSSTELIAYRHRNLGKKELKIIVYEDGADPSRLYWEKTDGSIGVLEMNRQAKKKFDGMSVEDYRDYQTRERATKIKQKHAKVKTGYVSNAQEEILAEISASGPASKPTKNPRLPPSINKKIAQQQGREALMEVSRSLLDPSSVNESSLPPAPPLRSTASAQTGRSQLSKVRANFQKNFLPPTETIERK